MKRQMRTIQQGLFTSVIVLVTAGLPAWAQYAGGSGTADDPYLIETAEQMNTIGLYPADWNKQFRLTANIDMNDLGDARVNLIGTLNDPFEGVFDGNDHTIANLVYHVKDEDSPSTWSSVLRIGLFRVISGWDAMVKNLGLIEPDLRPDPNCTRPVDYLGALVGTLSEGWIRNCYVKGGHVLGRNSVGGMVGGCYGDAAVSECWSTAEVSGDRSVGGLVGYGAWVSVWSCHAQARVSGLVEHRRAGREYIAGVHDRGLLHHGDRRGKPGRRSRRIPARQRLPLLFHGLDIREFQSGRPRRGELWPHPHELGRRRGSRRSIRSGDWSGIIWWGMAFSCPTSIPR